MRTKVVLLGLVSLIMASSCKKDEEDPAPIPTTGDSPALATAKSEAVANYANIVLANYEDALSTSQVLKTAIDAFVAAPSESGLQACKTAWLAARQPYGQTEVYRFYAGPIDDTDGPEGLINAWPMDEAYVDHVDGNPNAGIVNDAVTYPVIDGALLESLNEAGSETNISTGYHAIEFLLWGQDQSTTTAGVRPLTDYTSATNAVRRGQYLAACAERLVVHLAGLVGEWDNGGSNYRSTFVAGGNNAAITSMLQGIGFMSKGELAGERMFVAWDTQDQEDEHSCFSDNTHNDIRMNAQGLYNIWFGTYTRVDGSTISGTGIDDVLAIANSDVANTTNAKVTGARDLCFTIPAPFDQEILGADQASEVYMSILALRESGDQLAAAASTLGLSITVE